MKESFFKKYGYLFLINLLLVVVFIFFYGRFGDIIVDSFREAYISQKVLEGKTLYKDIFTIYAPFSYLFNAFLFWIFGVKLKVLYFAGFFTTAGVLSLTYKIAKKFLPNFYAFGIVLFIISIAVLSPNVFNYIYPYSYGILYGILFALGSIYCVINKQYFWAYFLYSFAICSKYEFVLLLLPLIFFTGFKHFGRYLLAVLIPIILNIIPLLISGLKPDDIIFTLLIVIVMGRTSTLHWFYSISGLFFRWELIIVYITEFIKSFLPIVILNKFKHLAVIILLFVYFYFVVSPKLFVYLFPVILLLFILNYKKLNSKQKFVILSSLLISLKVFFAETFQSYGVFFIPFGLISIFILTPKRYKKALLIVIISCSMLYGAENIHSLINKNIKIGTERGVIYTTPFYGETIKEANEFIKNTKKEDKVIIYPECLAPNFLSDRESDSKMYSLIPMYVETFGEDLIISRLEMIKPQYIIVSNYDTSNYRFSYFGINYAKTILNYILENYHEVKQIENGFSMIIYKRK